MDQTGNLRQAEALFADDFFDDAFLRPWPQHMEAVLPGTSGSLHDDAVAGTGMRIEFFQGCYRGRSKLIGMDRTDRFIASISCGNAGSRGTPCVKTV